MTWYPIAFAPNQTMDLAGMPYSGAVLKAYAAQTTNPIAMATSYLGVTTALQFVLNSYGYPSHNGVVVIPHVQEDYKLALYPDQVSADADSGALWTIDDNKIADETTSPFFETFSGDDVETVFTLSQSMGTDEDVLMVFADMPFGEWAQNGSFDSDTVWTKGTGWSIGSGVATATGAISTDLSQTPANDFVFGEAYVITYDITRTAGSITPNLGGGAGTARSASGSYRDLIVAGSTQEIKFSTSGFTGTVDNVKVHKAATMQRRILRSDEFSLNNSVLTLNTAPLKGTNNILVFSPSSLFGALSNITAAATQFWLQPVDAATTSNITLSGVQSIDGASRPAGNRILVHMQTDPTENGVWVVAAGAWARASDAAEWGDIFGKAVAVINGDVQAGYTYLADIPSTGTIGTDDIEFEIFNIVTQVTDIDQIVDSVLEKIRALPQNSQSADYTLQQSDAGKHIYHPSADTTARTITIPDNGSVAFEIGTTITIVNDDSAGALTISITSDTLVAAGSGSTGSRTLSPNGIATIIKVDTTRWIINGVNLA